MILGQHIRSADIHFALVSRYNIYNGASKIEAVNGIDMQRATTKQPNASMPCHLQKIAHIGEEARWTNNTIIQPRTFEVITQPLFSFANFELPHPFAIEHRNIDKALYSAVKSFVDKVNIGLIIYVHIGNTIFLTGNTDGAYHNIYIIADTPQSICLRYFGRSDVYVGNAGKARRITHHHSG